MPTPTYVVQRIGDQYIPVPQSPNSRSKRFGWILAGTLTMAVGLRRGKLLGMAAAAAGGAMIARGALGVCPMALLGCCRDGPSGDPTLAPSYQNDFPGRAPQQPADVVDEQSMESFPASDSPARTGVDLP